MKKILFILSITIIGLECAPANTIVEKKMNHKIVDNDKPKHKLKSNSIDASLSKVSTIDNLDTVVFDMSNSIVVGNKVSFPIKFFSDDDPIFALDFSFKFNQLKLVYDTTINLKPSIFSSLGYYNPSDSTVRFTSSGLSSASFPDTIDIAIVRFTVLSGTLTSSDLNTVKAFLNGDPCSIKVNSYSTVGLNNITEDASLLSVFPNPTNDVFQIVSKADATAEIRDLNGKRILSPLKVLANQTTTIDVSQLAKGIYMLKVFNNNFSKYEKVVIE
jgi:hypothetical protein